ncbi:PREDICTED: trypsin II-P29-like [Fulmarus glacialis]|uniref:trypsin II-P29-like n=1 Tax=Fulmarus glacialis TaxID=30455 RepID=UPI00051AEDA7|nr:PREDICTED: trypsin II-P29-like [Fulmarus glacialis]
MRLKGTPSDLHCSQEPPGVGQFTATISHSSLINNQWVLSAAHCQKSYTQLRMGEYNIDLKEDSELVRSALIIHHPRYDSRSLDNDIMLIKLATTIDYSADIQPTALPISCAKEGPECLFQGEETH